MTEDSFRSIVKAWYAPLYRFAYSLCRNREDALDRTQNAFQKLAQSASSIRDQSKIKSWLFSVLHREFIDDYRHHKRFPKSSLELMDDPQDDNPSENDKRIDSAKALHCLQQLETKFRAPLSLFYLEDFSYKEIAETLDIPIGTVMSRLRRGKDQLRILLESATCSDNASKVIPAKTSHG